MVRKERPVQDDNLAIELHGRKSPRPDDHRIVDYWMEIIRKRMPEGAMLSATVQLKPADGYLASFRLLAEGESLSSEARAETVDEAVEKAGFGLCQHLPSSGEFDGVRDRAS